MFVLRPRCSPSTAARVLEEHASGKSVAAIAHAASVHPQTVRRWLRHPCDLAQRAAACERCGLSHPNGFDALGAEYAYLLGAYLGDGHLLHTRSSWLLRVSLDVAYPGIISEVSAAVAVVSGRVPTPRPDPAGKSCVHLASTWMRWSCLLPQHGPGRKHDRPIILEPWQKQIVDANPGMLLRGLVHTDGWRGANRVRVKGRDYAYPRYQFSNRSDDIRRIFTDACDALGIEWRPWGRWHISVARREAVRRMDEFIGPKV